MPRGISLLFGEESSDRWMEMEREVIIPIIGMYHTYHTTFSMQEWLSFKFFGKLTIIRIVNYYL